MVASSRSSRVMGRPGAEMVAWSGMGRSGAKMVASSRSLRMLRSLRVTGQPGAEMVASSLSSLLVDS